MGRPVVDDLLGGDRADAGKSVEVGDRRAAETDGRNTRAAAPGAASTCDRGRPRPAGDPTRHQYLNPVGERRGEVDRGRVGLSGRAARASDGIGDPAALLQPVETGSRDRTRHVYDDPRCDCRRLGYERRLSGRGRCSGTGQGAAGDREQREQSDRRHESLAAGDGQGGHEPTVPGESSQLCDDSVPKLCRLLQAVETRARS